MPGDQPWEIGLGSEKYWDFLVRARHERAIPNESKNEDETERGEECDGEFFPIHNLFGLKFLLGPIEAESFFAKRDTHVDLNLSSDNKNDSYEAVIPWGTQPELSQKRYIRR